MISPFEVEAQWQQVLRYGTRQFFKRKTVVYRQGTPGEGFYFVKSGLVKISASTSGGNERLLNLVVPGQLLGMQALDGQTHFTTAVTAKDSVLYHFPCASFTELMKEKPELIHLVAQTMIQKMRILLFAINSKTLSTKGQIAIILLNLFDDFGNYEISLSQKEIANCTGLTRITVYKILRQWQEEGIIEWRGRAIRIKNPDRLKHALEDR